MYKITDEVSLRSAIDKYIKFYAEERLQERFHCKTPLEVRSEALSAETPIQYPIAENKRIEAYKAKWCASSSLARQEREFARYDLDLSTKTMANWIINLCRQIPETAVSADERGTSGKQIYPL